MVKGDDVIHESVRSDFPILRTSVKGKPLIYLDNSATSQKPRQVISALENYYLNYNSNIHRAVHHLSEISTEKYEGARKKAAAFIKARSEREIVFTKNATESINLVSSCLGLNRGDEVVLTIMEHHSNIVPWQMLKEKGVILKFIDIDNDGYLKTDMLQDVITRQTKVFAFTQASNVLGTINDVKELAKIAHDNDLLTVVDGAQAVPHMPVDVHDLDADFLAFSSHKMLGPTGVGVLYGKEEHLESMRPFLRGGDMIKEVDLEETTFNEVPHKFEAGTPNIADTIAFGEALDYLTKLGMENVRKHEIDLTRHAFEKLSPIPGVTLYGPKDAERKAGVMSFNISGVHSHDVAQVLNDEGIAIRSGHACAMPLMKRLGIGTVGRASFYVYNTKEEIDKLAEGVEKVKAIFKVK